MSKIQQYYKDNFTYFGLYPHKELSKLLMRINIFSILAVPMSILFRNTKYKKNISKNIDKPIKQKRFNFFKKGFYWLVLLILLYLQFKTNWINDFIVFFENNSCLSEVPSDSCPCEGNSKGSPFGA